jgi:hypothetical protein
MVSLCSSHSKLPDVLRRSPLSRDACPSSLARPWLPPCSAVHKAASVPSLRCARLPCGAWAGHASAFGAVCFCRSQSGRRCVLTRRRPGNPRPPIGRSIFEPRDVVQRLGTEPSSAARFSLHLLGGALCVPRSFVRVPAPAGRGPQSAAE